MEERNNRFFDKCTNTFYDNLTKEEYKTLQYFYRKERYMLWEQHLNSSTYTATDIAAVNDSTEEKIFQDETTDVESEVMGKIILNDMLDSLSEDERNAVALCILGGYSDREAGIIMDKHESSVRRCRLRAQKKMREYLKNAEIDDYITAKQVFNGKVIDDATESILPIGKKMKG